MEVDSSKSEIEMFAGNRALVDKREYLVLVRDIFLSILH